MRALFPLDGSDETYAAVDRALRLLAGHGGASATFLVVVSKAIREMPPEAREHLEFDDEDELFVRDDEARAVLTKAQALAKKAKFKSVHTKTVIGKTREAILAEAAHHDVLVMHALRRSEREDRKHGNMVERLAREAPCSVLLVRKP